jgi:predicted permease
MSPVYAQVWQALAPVFVLIAAGAFAAQRRWVGADTVAQLSKLVFFVFMPGLLFRTMSKAQVADLDFSPLAAYFSVILGVFAVLWWSGGRTARAATLALACVFSNLVMIGIPLITVAYGPQGLLTLLTLVSVHAMVLLIVATLSLEWGRAQALPGVPAVGMGRQLLQAARGAIVHPVPIPILAGLAFAATGWTLPEPVDRSLQWLGAAAGPLALVMLGASTYLRPIAQVWRGAMGVVGYKLLAQPALVLLACGLWGLEGLPVTVLVVVAALPVGANVFLFSQRYQSCEQEVTAASSVSTVLAAATVSGWMVFMAWFSHA